MRLCIILLLVSAIGAAGLADEKKDSTSITVGTNNAPALPERPGWKLVWHDEFDYEGLPDTNKWDYEQGFVRNSEPQFYTRARKENARVENGALIIEARKERFESYLDPWNDIEGGKKKKTADYTSASLITKNKASFKYGRMEIRFQLPEGSGSWPAIWMLGTNINTVSWPACGEVDILEFFGRNNPRGWSSNLYWGKDGGSKKSIGGGRSLREDEKVFTVFHELILEWNEDRMDFYVGGGVGAGTWQWKYMSADLAKCDMDGGNPFRKPMYLLINLALYDTKEATFPMRFVIDYVRVYEKATNAVPAVSGQ
jgi:beta-glucanase (GH16 family)